MKNFIRLFLLIVFSQFSNSIFAQPNTVGLIYSDVNASDGYTLFTPSKNNNVYLIDNCGELINEWTFSENPGLTCYLLENGNLLRAGLDSLEIRSWDNTLLWSYAMNLNGLKQHHDIEPLPNGNILCIITDNFTDAEIVAEGRDPSITAPAFRMDKIVELQPVGTNDAIIVWEWKFADHLIQDFDNSKPNFGVVQDHPELIDINFNNGFDDDWTHVNSIDYNSSLDQIVISSRNMSEVIIIDHSTNTAEAAGHTGGTSNRGGDFLWRWGNPQVYRQGVANDQFLYSQHDCRWVTDGYTDGGKITVFNNGGDGAFTFSSVHTIEPEIVNNAYTMTGNLFLPASDSWSWNGSILGDLVFENKKSGVNGLPNGNFMICETMKGRISEIKPDGTLMWCYINPSGFTIHNQFDTNLNGLNQIFRGEKYPFNYAGLIGQNLTPQGIIEDVNTVSVGCQTAGNTILEQEQVIIINPVTDNIIRFKNIESFKTIRISDVKGKIIYTEKEFSGNALDAKLNSGVYFMELITEKKTEVIKIIVN